MFARVIAAIVILALAALLLVATWPQLFGLERTQLIAQFISFRGLTAALAVGAFAVLLVIAAVNRRGRRFALSLAAVFLAFSLAGLAILSARGFGATEFATKAAGGITVVEWNTLGGAAGASVIAKLAIDSGADIVSLPETNEEVADAVAAVMTTSGHPVTVNTLAFNHIAQAKSTSVLISTRLGGYHQDTAIGSTSTVPTVVLRPDTGVGPVIVGVHAVAPQPADLADWRADLEFLKKTCTDPNVIMAGDFNATLDHFAGLGNRPGTTIGNCSDAGQASGNAGVGTWPSSLTALAGAPIDHVLTTDGWRVTGMRVVRTLDKAGSDHRPIVVQLAPTR
jgi:endonuclease/exonuclease/phosphatase (EEP) superfamily protein YafD